MRYAGIKRFDIENGVGVGLTLFTQGCSKFCNGCHNQHTWDKCGGKEFTDETLKKILDFYKNNPRVKRVTLSGGDPLESLELSELILTNFKELFPNHKVWVYTGYTYEYLINNIEFHYILKYIDVLVDGKFEIDKYKLGLKYKGSENQRLVNVQESLKQNKIILLDI